MKVFSDDRLLPVQKTTYMASNSTSVNNYFSKEIGKVEKMYKKKAFMHWYLNEGMEESTFSDFCEDIEALVEDYKEAAKEV